ncbi:arylformamidase [Thermoflavimicrobium dichotomicum]|uniref:Kynurenine formamidase n=1 Tax=Thermoflavimicrobium dichotomicum TaxID=46223 RepID=A0A1I3LEW5_9BACL|nr:arylformamidase [Thermoflavimicrobium dichotomicum]SFI83319.1 arylformamidase [Thermoflavimicrobium dichotomicum]
MIIIDISEPLREGVATWPGDTPYRFQLNWTKEETGSVNVGKMEMSIHTGTHIDAPYHFDNEGKKVHELDLSLYVGPCRVIHLLDLPSIGAAELAHFDLGGVKRLIIRTDSWKDRLQFPTSFTYIRPDLAPFLQERGIQLLGLDVPSVDLPDSKELPAHHALHQHGVHILEGAVLNHVEEGDYELIALPLPLDGADGSPVRAVLRK